MNLKIDVLEFVRAKDRHLTHEKINAEKTAAFDDMSSYNFDPLEILNYRRSIKETYKGSRNWKQMMGRDLKRYNFHCWDNNFGGEGF